MRTRLLVALLIAVLLLPLSPTLAQDSLNVTRVNTLSYWATWLDMDVQGQYAFLASAYAGVRVVDCSTPTDPQEVAAWPDCYATSLTLSGQHLYVIDNSERLAVLDVSDPLHLSLAGEFTTTGIVAQVLVYGNYVYLVKRYDEILVLDISDPTAPVQVSTLTLEGYIGTVQIVDHFAYVASMDYGLLVFDLTDPVNPAIAGRLDVPGNAGAVDLTVAGNYASVNISGNRIVIADISNPTNPTYRGYYEESGDIYDLSAAANNLFVATGFYYEGFGAIRVIDLSDPTSPTLIHSEPVPGLPTRIRKTPGFLYLSGYDTGFVVFDLSVFPSPGSFGRIYKPGDMYRFDIVDDIMYQAAGTEGMYLLDISDPDNIEILSKFRPSGGSNRAIVDIEVDEDVAYIVREDKLFSVDVSDPAAPQEITYYNFGSESHPSIVLRGTNLFLTTTYSLQVIDVSNPANPTELDFVATGASNLDVEGDYAYVTAHSGNFHIYDVSNPANVTLVSTTWFDNDRELMSIDVVGDCAYFMSANDGLLIVDVSDPANPVEVSFLDLPGTGMDLWYDQGMVYTEGPFGYLSVVDVQDPQNPTIAGYYDTGTRVRSVRTNAGLIFANNQRQLNVFELMTVTATVAQAGTDTPVAAEYELLSAYPNPFNAMVSVTVLLPSAGLVNVKLYNMLGQQVLGRAVQGQGGYQTVSVDASHLSSGAYVLEVRNGSQQRMQKVTLLK
ncbi:T9SS type A sorting domain-containing protein [bacterium]|nr:T9SS type A sorting domain-containing protein [bacterium]